MGDVKTPCRLCGGRQHVLQGEKWVPCKCSLPARIRRQMMAADVEREIWSRKIQQNGLLEHALSRVREQSPLLIVGGEPLDRWQLAKDILVHVIEQGGYIYAITIDKLIDSYFSEDPSPKYFAFYSSCLWLRMDFLRKHSWRESVLAELLNSRTGHWTIITLQKVYRDIPVAHEVILLGKGA